MFDTVINYLDKFGPELLVIQFGFLVILSTLFLWLWFSNRRKYHNLKHAIPATIVKSYLDSIIQNSTALKSSLFRGGGLDLNGVPSVMPLTHLVGGDSLGLSGAPSTALLEELNHKKAIIASLEAQLISAQSSQRELEAKVASTQGHLGNAEKKIKELEALLAKSRNSGGGDETLKAELEMVIKERDELRDRLKEFEIISDDLANLKRLQQENDQLKRSISSLQISIPVAEAKQVVPEAKSSSEQVSSNLATEEINVPNESSETNQALEDFVASSDGATEEDKADKGDKSEEDMLAAMEEQYGSEKAGPKKVEKTPEDLLSEFEKMLG